MQISKVINKSSKESQNTKKTTKERNLQEKFNKIHRIIRAPIAILGENEIFGIDEILNEEKRKTQAKCNSSTSIIFSIKTDVK